jgi:hypothetical protein
MQYKKQPWAVFFLLALLNNFVDGGNRQDSCGKTSEARPRSEFTTEEACPFARGKGADSLHFQQ